MPNASFLEVGRSGLPVWSGRPHAEPLRELRGREGYRVYNEMRLNDPIIGATLFAIEQSVRALPWFVAPEDNPRAGFIQSCLDDMSHSFNDHLSEALTMLPFGWAWFEIIYKRRTDGRVGWRKFAIRGQNTLHRWEMDEAGGIRGMAQVCPPDFKPVTIPIEKSLLYRTRVEQGNPEGRSILRAAYPSYYFVRNLREIEAIGIERDLCGLPMLVPPESADLSEGSADRAAAENLLRRVRNDEEAGVLVPPGWSFSLVSGGGAKANVHEVIVRYETRIALSVLAQFLMLGLENTGSLALARTQAALFSSAVSAFADIIADTFTRFAVRPLLELNALPAGGVALQHGPLGQLQYNEIGAFLAQMSGAGLLNAEGDAGLETWVRELVNAPALAPEAGKELKAGDHDEEAG
ncbi:MAG: hypothetical protein JXB47_05870 [Anaerolineae bacterium]|nr:hypothetical protein [Anaerolineae bacterium]